jgi:hypothetical protein
MVEGRTYTAQSRHGPANQLARQLVAAGLPDRSMVIRYRGLAGTMTYRSVRYDAKAGERSLDVAVGPRAVLGQGHQSRLRQHQREGRGDPYQAGIPRCVLVCSMASANNSEWTVRARLKPSACMSYATALVGARIWRCLPSSELGVVYISKRAAVASIRGGCGRPSSFIR